jgi:signal transduction histidine kinase
MSPRQKRQIACLAGLLLAHALVSLGARPGAHLSAFSDIAQFLLLMLASAVMVANAVSTRGQTRLFWSLMAAGCALWAVDLALWAAYEVLLHREVPDPFVGDVILFIHVVPFMAALALRPHRPPEHQKLHFSTLNFLMLLIWWVFLYAFIVFPDEYVTLNIPIYSHNYDVLYSVENLILLAALGLLALSTQSAWKRIYWNLFAAMAVYAASSEAMNAAIADGRYYSGSLYDIPFAASLCWLIWAGLLAHQLRPACEPAQPERPQWLILAPRFAMLAILSLPVFGYWAWFGDTSPVHLRRVRLLVALAAMLVLGLFVFVRQYLLDRELVRLLDRSRQSLDNQQRLQTQLVQKEKLASLGQLVSGAAHEINNPLTAILGYSDLLAADPGLETTQIDMAQKIKQQARRTQELISGLLSFAQQSPGEKTLVDLGALAERALHMEMLRLESKHIRVESSITRGLPPIWGNSNQLFRCCLEIIGNAADALDETSGGVFRVSSRLEAKDVVLEFSDSGPGMRDPQRVFDPFYTTKPIGKGAGLGLSATYGVVQDHRGQITCHNRPEGGAIFVLRLPSASQTAPGQAETAKAQAATV